MKHMENIDMGDATDRLAELERILQVQFHDRTLLKRAVTHHTCCPDNAVRDSYDTLEFLGDAIISAHVVEYIFRTHPTASEGEMTAIKSEAVSRRVFARIGQSLGLFPFICVDIANLRTFNDRSRDSLCADVLEAVVGAIHIDRGAEVARDFVARVILPMVEEVSHQAVDTNPKGRLQKIILRRSGSLPRYRVLEQSGRSNDRAFVVGVFERDTLIGVGKASSIKEAGRMAALEALETFFREHGSDVAHEHSEEKGTEVDEHIEDMDESDEGFERLIDEV
ncbi:MAG TPA: ribonuclease III [Ktedonobacter sp.]|nr:ribonuclease III [Ktedonobacter sp.]